MRTPFSELAATFRRQVVPDLIKVGEYSFSDAAELLSRTATERGFVERAVPVPASAVAEWCQSGKTPQWAALAAMSLLLQRSWQPSTPVEWAGFAALHFRMRKSHDLSVLLASIPPSFSADTASGWLAAAIEEDSHYRSRKRHRPLLQDGITPIPRLDNRKVKGK